MNSLKRACGNIIRKYFPIVKKIHIELRFGLLNFRTNIGKMLFVNIE